MVDSVSGNTRINQPLPADRKEGSDEAQKGEQKAEQKAEKVSLGHSLSNSTSIQQTALPEHLTTELQGKPSLPSASGASISQEVLSDMKLKATTGLIRAELQTGLEELAKNQGKIPEPLVYNVAQLDYELATITEIPEDKLQGLRETSGKLSQAIFEGSLTSGKLEEILSELKTQLEDTSIKRTEQDIKSRMAEIEKTAEKKIELLRLAIKIEDAWDHRNAAFGDFHGTASNTLRYAIPGLKPEEEWIITRTIAQEIRQNPDGNKLDIIVDAIMGRNSSDKSKRYVQHKMAVLGGKLAAPEHFAGAFAITDRAIFNAELKVRLTQLAMLDKQQETLSEALDSLQSGDPTAAEAILKQSGDKQSGFGLVSNPVSVLGELFEQQQGADQQKAMIQKNNLV